MTNYYCIKTSEGQYIRQTLCTYKATNNLDFALTNTDKNKLKSIAEELKLKNYSIESYI